MIGDFAKQVISTVEKSVVGRRADIEAVLVGFLSEGHVILEGAPGTAKTLIVRALAAASGCLFRRIQFTPDLMPADILGTNVFDPKTSTFQLVRGPIFSEFVLADEINRAPAKTQAALLECMEEHNVTIDGVAHALPSLFTVFATMNPIDFEGTFPLPEAQLDRFLMKITLKDVDADSERELISRYAAGFDPWSLTHPNAHPPDMSGMAERVRTAVRLINIESHVQAYLVEIVRRTRQHPAVSWGASTRSAVALLRASRARAACEQRDFVIPDDIKFIAPYVLAHRLVLRPEAQLEEVDGVRVVREILDSTPVPRT